MIYKKSFSKNKKKTKPNLKRQRHNSLDKVTIKSSPKLKNKKLSKITEKSLSPQYIVWLLSSIAFVLMIIYSRSILIYWQQTYHFEMFNSNTLITHGISTEQLEEAKTSNNIQDNVFIIKDNNSISTTAIRLPINKDQTTQLTQMQEEVKVEIKTKGQIVEKQKASTNLKTNVQLSKQNDIQIQPITKNESLLTEVPHVPETLNSLPILLSEKNKVLFAGDSLMQGVAPYVKKMLFKQYKIESIDFSKQSTGLAYPSVFDWPKTISDNLIADPSIKLIIVFLGPNDPWDFPVKGYSKYAKFKSEQWEEQYRLRIATILNNAREHNVQVLWLAAPCMRKPKLNDGMVYLNTLYKSELEKTQQHFITTNELLGCTYEKFSNFVETDKEKIKVRVDDGIHFTPTGQKILAQAIMNKISFSESEDTHSD